MELSEEDLAVAAVEVQKLIDRYPYGNLLEQIYNANIRPAIYSVRSWDTDDTIVVRGFRNFEEFLPFTVPWVAALVRVMYFHKYCTFGSLSSPEQRRIPKRDLFHSMVARLGSIKVDTNEDPVFRKSRQLLVNYQTSVEAAAGDDAAQRKRRVLGNQPIVLPSEPPLHHREMLKQVPIAAKKRWEGADDLDPEMEEFS